MVLSTCNRVEVYAVVEAFHGGLSVIGSVLSEHSGMSLNDLTKYAYVRYAEAAVEHLFAVASGLDSAVIGEQQVLGQVRRAYATAEANHTVGRTLHELSQRALSVGKRVHSEASLADAHRGLLGRREPQHLVICDPGRPRDVDPAIAGLPGVFVVDMDRIQREPSARAAASDAEAARTIVAAEVANYLTG